MQEKKQENFFHYLAFAAFLVFLMIFLYLFISDNQGFLHDFARTYGLVGIFFGAIIANATVFLPIPFDALIFFAGANPQLAGFESFSFISAIAIALIGGIGAAMGEMTAYIAGLTGVKALEKFHKKEFGKLKSIRYKLHHQGMWFIFFGLLTPFPFDIVGITAGVIKYDYKKFLVAAAAGKSLRYFIVFLAGHFGFELVRTFFHL